MHIPPNSYWAILKQVSLRIIDAIANLAVFLIFLGIVTAVQHWVL